MKKEKKNSIRKFMTLIKRASKPKQPPKEKVSKPKSYVFRRAGAITFWILFAFMFLFVFVNVFSPSPSTEAKVEEPSNQNYTTQLEAIQFAIDFSREYLTWDIENMETRQERLQNYLAVGMDENAGLDIKNVNWNSTFQGATLKKVNEINENKSHIVLHVKSELTREIVREIAKEEEGDEEDEENKKPKIEKEIDKEQLDKYLVVPVGYDGENLGIYSQPYFTNIDDENKSKVSNDNLTRGLRSPENSEEKINIQNFLDTFFSSYAEDDTDKLSYILNDESIVGLNGAMNFVEVKKSDVYQGENENQFIVYAEVTFTDPNTELNFNSTHYLLVRKENNRYVVDQMNAENYIEEITGNSILSSEEPEEETGELDMEDEDD